MKIIADTHTHTIACDHAYSTITENTAVAKRKGLKFICMTEHGPSMPDAPNIWHFFNLKTLPNKINDVIVLRGCEANIISYDGTLDFPKEDLKLLDWVIASYHSPVIEPSTIEDHTNGWLAIANNPDVDVIGHCGDERFAFDYDRVIAQFAKNNKIVEINSHSFTVRPGTTENCRKIAEYCKKHQVRIVVSSDAHYSEQIGEVGNSLSMLKEIDFPEHLILNANYDVFLKVIQEKSAREFM